VILVSGGFDPLHVGHVEYIEKASSYGRVVVALNSDEWLVRKKGYVFQSWEERAKILASLKAVSQVVKVKDEDGTVCEAIKRLKPEYFGNGGDRGPTNTPESELCSKLGVKTLYGLGKKVQTSSGLVNKVRRFDKDWGHYEVVYDTPGLKVKTLTVLPGKQTSLQKHFNRDEYWFNRDDVKYIPRGEVHQLKNQGFENLTVLEVQVGRCTEDDIERL
jgi:cytidyltransferase-like protein